MKVIGAEKGGSVNPQIRFKQITEAVCEYYGIPFEVMMGKKRTAYISEARQIAMLLCSEFARWVSLEMIGEFFRRDHGTVMHGKRNITNLIDTHTQVKKRALEIREIVNNL